MEEIFNWDKLMLDSNWEPEVSEVNHEPNLSEFDHWLSEQYALKDSATSGNGSRKDQSQILSPPLYAGFSSASRSGEQHNLPPEYEVTERNLRSSVEILQIE